jgi:hypothetical protein
MALEVRIESIFTVREGETKREKPVIFGLMIGHGEFASSRDVAFRHATLATLHDAARHGAPRCCPGRGARWSSRFASPIFARTPI